MGALPERDEDLLHRVLSVGAIRREAPSKRPDAPAMDVQALLHGVFFAGGDTLEERLGHGPPRALKSVFERRG